MLGLSQSSISPVGLYFIPLELNSNFAFIINPKYWGFCGVCKKERVYNCIGIVALLAGKYASARLCGLIVGTCFATSIDNSVD